MGQYSNSQAAAKRILDLLTTSHSSYGGTAIEQNPEKPSRWGQLARYGHNVIQFKDRATNRFVAVSVDGKVKEYGGHRS